MGVLDRLGKGDLRRWRYESVPWKKMVSISAIASGVVLLLVMSIPRHISGRAARADNKAGSMLPPAPKDQSQLLARRSIANICADNRLDADERALIPPFAKVPAQEYRADWHLINWVPEGRATVVIEDSFEIMMREITELDFAIIGHHGFISVTHSDQVKSNISWHDAKSFATTLSRRTRCHFDLPSYEQWLAAVIWSGANPREATTRSMSAPARAEPMLPQDKPKGMEHLLGNLREWSRDACDGGHHLLGEDYVTFPPRKSTNLPCKDLTSKTFGFRLVRTDNNLNENPSR